MRGPSRKELTAFSLATFTAVMTGFLVFCYPVWVVAMGGDLGLELPALVPVWRADFHKTEPFFILIYGFVGLGAALIPWAVLRQPR